MTPLSVRLLLYKSYLWQFLYGMMRLLYFTIIIISKEILSIQICSPNCKYTRQEIAKSTLLDNLYYIIRCLLWIIKMIGIRWLHRSASEQVNRVTIIPIDIGKYKYNVNRQNSPQNIGNPSRDKPILAEWCNLPCNGCIL
eukprot:1005342_1